MANRRSRARPARTGQQLRRGAQFAFVVAALVLVGLFLWDTGRLQGLLARLGVPVPAELVAPDTPAVVAEGTIDVYFTTPALVYPDVAGARPAQPFLDQLIADMDGATRSIDMAVFEYNLMAVADALIRAHARGVQVRLALDRENLEKPAMAAWAGEVEQAGIPIAWEESDGFLHSKFVIIDDQVVWTGSWNATENDTYRNNNNLLRIVDARLVENYATEFEQMSAGRFGISKQARTPYPRVAVGQVQIANYFSPADRAAPEIVARLEQAEQSIRFLAFSFTSDPIAEALIDRARSGIPVSGVMEARNVEGEGSEFEILRRNRISVIEDGNCYTMHHKVIIIDERTVITGSYNFTRRAEETNDENFLIIDDPALAQQYLREFARVWSQAENPTRCSS